MALLQNIVSELFYLQGEIQALFLRHEGYLGAVGAFLKGAAEEGIPQYFSNNFLDYLKNLIVNYITSKKPL